MKFWYFLAMLLLMFASLRSFVIQNYHWAFYCLGLELLIALMVIGHRLLENQWLLKILVQNTMRTPTPTNEATPPQ